MRGCSLSARLRCTSKGSMPGRRFCRASVAGRQRSQVIGRQVDLRQTVEDRVVASGIFCCGQSGEFGLITQFGNAQAGLAGEQQAGGKHQPAGTGQCGTDAPQAMEARIGGLGKLVGGGFTCQAMYQQFFSVAVAGQVF